MLLPQMMPSQAVPKAGLALTAACRVQICRPGRLTAGILHTGVGLEARIRLHTRCHDARSTMHLFWRKVGFGHEACTFP